MAHHVLKGRGRLPNMPKMPMTPKLAGAVARVAALGASLALTLLGSPASAQTTATTISITTTGVAHSDLASREQNFLTPNVNHADCTNDDVMSFPVIVSANTLGMSLEVWAGAACDVATNRTNSNSTSCWVVYRDVISQATFSVPVHVRDMLAGVSNTTTTTTDGGADGGTTTTLPTTGTLVQNTPATVCTQQKLTLFFLVISGQVGDMAAAKTTYDVNYKLIGPPPPINLSAGIGESELVVHFNSDPSAVDQLQNGFKVYCDPPPGAAADAGVTDAGITDAGVTDAGADGGSACPASTVLVPGADPPAKNLCGSNATRAGSQVTATHLINDVTYNVAVASTDTFFNTGPLSALACQSPKPVTSFYQAYRDAGGRGGGGFCAISQRRTGVASFALLGLAGLGMFLRRRAR